MTTKENSHRLLKSEEKHALHTCCTNWKVASLLPPTGIPWVCYCFCTPWNSPISSNQQQEVSPVSNIVNPISGFSKTTPPCYFQIKSFTISQVLPHALFLAPWTWVSQTLRSSLDLCPALAPMCCPHKAGSTISPGSESQAGPGLNKLELDSFDQNTHIHITYW